MSDPIDNIPPEKRRGNPNWVEGGPSPNPGGRPKKLVAIERMLDEEFRSPEQLREVFTMLRELALNGVSSPIVNAKTGEITGTKVTYHPAYMEMLLERLMGPVRDLDLDLSDAPTEALTYLRDKLKQ